MGLVVSGVAPTYAINHQEYFKLNLPKLVERIQEKGQVRLQIAKRALGRQVFEDSLAKKASYSCAGISMGSPNKEIVHRTLSAFNLKIGSASNGEGSFYVFSGPEANIASALVIVNLSDHYVGKFLKRDLPKWERGKELSKALALDLDNFELNQRFYQLKTDKILRRCCSIYGPGVDAVDRILGEEK
jgi:hypothetical protein